MPGLRGDEAGSLIAVFFGLIYVQVNTRALPAAAEWSLRVLASVALLAVVAAIYRRRDQRRGEPTDGRGFGRAYWLVVLAEAVALFVGLQVLAGPLDRPQAGVTWVSLVVGVHFFALAVVFEEPFFHLLGAAITTCGAVGLVLVIADVGEAVVDTVSGVVPGLLLLGFAWWGVQRNSRPVSPANTSAGTRSA